MYQSNAPTFSSTNEEILAKLAMHDITKVDDLPGEMENRRQEIKELEIEVENNSTHIEEEFGDVLFSLINYARFINVNAEDALSKTNNKFIKRFQKMEDFIINDEKKIEDLSLNEMDIYWEKAKKELKS